MEECQIQDHEISLSLCLFTTCFISDWITLIILFKHAQCLTKNTFPEHKRLGFYDSPNIFLRREQDYFFVRKKLLVLFLRPIKAITLAFISSSWKNFVISCLILFAKKMWLIYISLTKQCRIIWRIFRKTVLTGEAFFYDK